MQSTTGIHILDVADCVSLSANAHTKFTTRFLLPVIGKYHGRLSYLSLFKQALNQKENKKKRKRDVVLLKIELESLPSYNERVR